MKPETKLAILKAWRLNKWQIISGVISTICFILILIGNYRGGISWGWICLASTLVMDFACISTLVGLLRIRSVYLESRADRKQLDFFVELRRKELDKLADLMSQGDSYAASEQLARANEASGRADYEAKKYVTKWMARKPEWFK